jgi:hypothetical protein
MHCRLLLLALILLAACGDAGPEGDRFSGLWQLTSVNSQPLPSTGNTSGSAEWVAAVLQISQQVGSFDRCMEDPSTSSRTSSSTAIATHPLSGDKLAVQYFERRDTSSDTASVNGSQLTLRYRSVLVGGQVQGVDALTFAPLSGTTLPPACSLAP